MLIEVTPDLETICGHTFLGEYNGFIAPGLTDRTLDYSGLCYDPTRSAFWIVSDKARRVFLFDLAANRVIHNEPLYFFKDGQTRTVKKAEGVAYDPKTGVLYVVCESDARLYAYLVETK